MSFSDDEYFEVIQKNKQVKEAFNSIKEICNQFMKRLLVQKMILIIF